MEDMIGPQNSIVSNAYFISTNLFNPRVESVIEYSGLFAAEERSRRLVEGVLKIRQRFEK